MDKRILTKEELGLMKQFIAARSPRFAEPGILLEIMDHFACKTEELLEEEPAQGFEAAMKKAHHSFGIKGFAPIAEAYEKAIYHHYKQWYNKEQRGLLFSIHGIGLLCAGMLAGYSYWLLAHWHPAFAYGITVTFLLELLYAVGIFTLLTRYKKRKKHPLLFAKAQEAANRIFIWLWTGVVIIPLQEQLPAGYFALFIAALAFLLGFQFLSFRRLMDRVSSDATETNRQMELTL